MYLMSLMMERGDAANALRTAQRAGSEEAIEQIKEYLPPAIVEVLTTEQLESIRLGLSKLPDPPERIPLFWRDIRAAIVIFFLVALSTLPCSIPFLLIKDPVTAMRVSNGVAILLLFIAGFRLAKYTGYNKLLFGVIVAVLGFVLVGMTIALGG
jgi:VIT1/CCC1 family predicted Fe2+/Mn2+ transporter